MRHPQYCWRNSSSSFLNGNGLFRWFWRMRMPHHEPTCRISPTWFGTHEAAFPTDTIWCRSSHLPSRNKTQHSMSQNRHGKWWSMSSKKVKNKNFENYFNHKIFRFEYNDWNNQRRSRLGQTLRRDQFFHPLQTFYCTSLRHRKWGGSFDFQWPCRVQNSSFSRLIGTVKFL